MTIAYAIGRDGERIPLEETDRRTERHADHTDITIIAESSILADPVTIERVEWNDPFGVDWAPEYGPDAYSGQLPVMLLPGHTFGIEQQFYVKQDESSSIRERLDVQTTPDPRAVWRLAAKWSRSITFWRIGIRP